MIAFVFPGQGSQFVGMGDDLPTRVRERFMIRASQILGYNVSELCKNGPEEKLKQTEYTQPTIVITSIIAYEMIKERGIVPSFVAGHSVGEFSALYAAGVIDYDSTIKLVAERAKLMAEFGRGTMAAVIGLSIEDITNVVYDIEGVDVANINSPIQTVISGEEESVTKAGEELKEKGAKRLIPLNVSGAFHSFIFKDAAKIFADYIERFEFRKPGIPVFPNATAEKTSDPAVIKDCLKKQIVNPVKWVGTIRHIREEGVEIFAEVGPGKVLSGLIKRTVSDTKIFNIFSPKELENFITNLQ